MMVLKLEQSFPDARSGICSKRLLPLPKSWDDTGLTQLAGF